VKVSRVLYALLIAGFATWLWIRFAQSDEAKIQAQLDRLQALIEKEPGESALEAADRALRLTELLTQTFTVRLDPVGQTLEDPAALSRPYVGLRRAAESLDATFSDVEIELQDGGRAEVRFEAALSGRIEGSFRRGRYPVRARFEFERGEWRMSEIRVGLEVEGGLF
jgi:hypothetical protein